MNEFEFLKSMEPLNALGSPNDNRCFVEAGEITKDQFGQLFGIDYDTNKPLNQENTQPNTQGNAQNNSKLFNNQSK